MSLTDTRLPIVRTVADLRAAVAAARAQGRRVGLVPTMGALHEGHLSLVRLALAQAPFVIASVFVNPTQFGPNEDFGRYPRQEAADAAMLAGAGAALLFAPSVDDVYAEGATTSVTAGPISTIWCGAYRPGHFDGVATVVTKLLLMSGADVAVFGEKDYQQLQVIRTLVRDLNIATDIIGAPLVRDADGLALSSRNAYLSADQRASALALPQALFRAAERLRAGDAVEPVLADARRTILEAGFDSVDYFALCDARTLAPLSALDAPARLLAAARIGGTRLIDNIAVQ